MLVGYRMLDGSQFKVLIYYLYPILIYYTQFINKAAINIFCAC